MAKKEKRIDYISKAEDIRLIASGVNAEHRTMTWREATEYWERTTAPTITAVRR